MILIMIIMIQEIDHFSDISFLTNIYRNLSQHASNLNCNIDSIIQYNISYLHNEYITIISNRLFIYKILYSLNLCDICVKLIKIKF